MSELDLSNIRRLRGDALELLAHNGADISQFLHKRDRLTFRRRPEQKSTKGDVKVTTSCSCLMALALGSKLEQVYPKKTKESAERAFLRIFRASWRTAGLGLNNAFSTVLVIRAFGMLVEAGVIEKGFA